MARQLRAIAALAEDLCLIPSTSMASVGNYAHVDIPQHRCILKIKSKIGTGEMSLRVGALAAPPEDSGSVLSTHRHGSHI